MNLCCIDSCMCSGNCSCGPTCKCDFCRRLNQYISHDSTYPTEGAAASTMQQPVGNLGTSSQYQASYTYQSQQAAAGVSGSMQETRQSAMPTLGASQYPYGMQTSYSAPVESYQMPGTLQTLPLPAQEDSAIEVVYDSSAGSSQQMESIEARSPVKMHYQNPVLGNSPPRKTKKMDSTVVTQHLQSMSIVPEMTTYARDTLMLDPRESPNQEISSFARLQQSASTVQIESRQFQPSLSSQVDQAFVQYSQMQSAVPFQQQNYPLVPQETLFTSYMPQRPHTPFMSQAMPSPRNISGSYSSRGTSPSRVARGTSPSRAARGTSPSRAARGTSPSRSRPRKRPSTSPRNESIAHSNIESNISFSSSQQLVINQRESKSQFPRNPYQRSYSSGTPTAQDPIYPNISSASQNPSTSTMAYEYLRNVPYLQCSSGRSPTRCHSPIYPNFPPSPECRNPGSSNIQMRHNTHSRDYYSEPSLIRYRTAPPETPFFSRTSERRSSYPMRHSSYLQTSANQAPDPSLPSNINLNIPDTSSSNIQRVPLTTLSDVTSRSVHNSPNYSLSTDISTFFPPEVESPLLSDDISTFKSKEETATIPTRVLSPLSAIRDMSPDLKFLDSPTFQISDPHCTSEFSTQQESAQSSIHEESNRSSDTQACVTPSADAAPGTSTAGVPDSLKSAVCSRAPLEPAARSQTASRTSSTAATYPTASSLAAAAPSAPASSATGYLSEQPTGSSTSGADYSPMTERSPPTPDMCDIFTIPQFDESILAGNINLDQMQRSPNEPE